MSIKQSRPVVEVEQVTSCLMVPCGLKKVKGGGGPIHHGQVLSDSAEVRGAHSPQFTIQRRL